MIIKKKRSRKKMLNYHIYKTRKKKPTAKTKSDKNQSTTQNVEEEDEE